MSDGPVVALLMEWETLFLRIETQQAPDHDGHRLLERVVQQHRHVLLIIDGFTKDNTEPWLREGILHLEHIGASWHTT